MCLTINHRNLKTASKDIPVYKFLLKRLKDGKRLSPYRLYPYTLNEVIEDKEEPVFTKDKKGRRVVTKGFLHSFLPTVDKQRLVDEYRGINKVKGVTIEIHKAIIPKGIKYYEGVKRDICSKKLLVLKDIVEIHTLT